MAEHTPMIKQYLQIKAQYEDAFLFFRLGDFYELFFEDAVKAAQELEITLTARGGDKEKIPMCGVPYHSAENYIMQLIEKGFKIAICEQVEDPKEAKGVVKREVVRMITPGTVMEGKVLQEKENNYIVAITDFQDGSYGIGRTDVTTGENYVTIITGSFDEVIQEVATIRAKEVVVDPSLQKGHIDHLQQFLSITVSYEENEELAPSFAPLCQHITQPKLERCFARLCNYLMQTQKRSLDHLQPVQYYATNEYMKIDYHSKRNLELIETLRDKKKQGSLLWVLDKTVTAMGGRLIKKWVERPLIDKAMIEQRLSAVQTLLDDYFVREEIRDELSNVYDLERLAGRVAYGNVNARDLVQLRKSLSQLPKMIQTVKQVNNPYLNQLMSTVDCCEELCDILEQSIVDDPPFSIKEGGMIRTGYHKELDTYRDASLNGKSWIAELELKERQETGIKSLKVGFNKVFGYYIEVTRANLHLLPEGRYERKQTLTNAERYITPELKEKEALILEAEEKMEQLEYELFLSIREEVKQYISKLQQIATSISSLDVLQSFATVSEKQHFVRPIFSTDREVSIVDGRHPVVEKVIANGEYVANDVELNSEREMLLITGPNMAGKSTYMRQLALISILAQIGSFVPATNAVLPIFDQVFTRIGAADDLARGQSTFMVEMLETKYALTKATQDSLLLLDEIGRGTSTYDGMALAQSIIEYIHNNIGAKTLFSTHYHELTSLEKELEKVKNVHVSAIEEEGRIVFLHKVINGQADRSYGIYVAQLAELPDAVIERASSLLTQFEQQSKAQFQEYEKMTPVFEQPEQLSLFEENKLEEKKRKPMSSQEKFILNELKELDILNTTPIEALRHLNELQKKLKK
ncbi:DNA mismatch repair protein MutS [Alkalihalobacillus sp. LMS39]|uniref:DNA mismatch repair protein MutS n=1 Tax=Alkalihalobacillus sp. LMS39 TaxID=2924032 RepID=UPI001FB379A2|nr:DNA mismatch repair protein MutS [Alkalihalobacillus sp. LMS39]UOE92767.1 DNA mismatch repair protein MutS [Alkalihalobacillus sp. LMS39]